MDKEKILVCSKCKNIANIRISPATALCKKHFEEHFEKKVSGTIREFSMLRKGEKVAVAISGGKDSAVLLHMMCKMKKLMPIKVSALLVDEGIHGYREKTIMTAKKECKKLGVPLHIISFEKEFGIPLDKMLEMKRKFGACAYCGVLRRACINTGAKRIGADKIAMGHNLDDAAQTVLLNIFRNEPKRLMRFGPAWLKYRGKNAEKFLPRIYPLIRCPEIEVAAYALMRGIKINFMQCPHANEAMRQNVRKMLNGMEMKYPGTKARALEAFLQMQKNYFEGMENSENKKKFAECKMCGEPSSSELCTACRMISEFEMKK